MAETRPKPLEPVSDDTVPDTERPERRTDSGVRELILQTEILDELRRMNRLLGQLSRGPRRYTLAFFSGIVRGLGAAIGATVVFALLIGLLSRVNTIPLIGGYLAKVYEFAATSSPTIEDLGQRVGPTTTATPAPEPASSAAPETTPAPETAASPVPTTAP